MISLINKFYLFITFYWSAIYIQYFLFQSESIIRYHCPSVTYSRDKFRLTLATMTPSNIPMHYGNKFSRCILGKEESAVQYGKEKFPCFQYTGSTVNAWLIYLLKKNSVSLDHLGGKNDPTCIICTEKLKCDWVKVWVLKIIELNKHRYGCNVIVFECAWNKLKTAHMFINCKRCKADRVMWYALYQK